MKKKVIIRQGDVLLTLIAKKPLGEWIKKKDYVVAQGEATGHHHTIYSPPEKHMEVLEIEGHRFVSVGVGFWLKHQEHDHLKLPTGIYEITMEKEYDPFEESRKTVID